MNFDDPFYSTQLITYLGNKRRLLGFLNQGFQTVSAKLGSKKLRILDGFAGTGVVSRLLKSYATELCVNDLEDYSVTLNTAFLTNYSLVDSSELKRQISFLNTHKLDGWNTIKGFIETNYSPLDDTRIKPGERVFYTRKNAHIIDTIRKRIDSSVPLPYQSFCLAALLVEASIHTNTSGIFKGFHKKNGVGHFGGKGEDALSRILQEIELKVPIFSSGECAVTISQKDINELILDPGLPPFDLVYYDPPYNEHPYGSNYFMLNVINAGKPCEIQQGVSGIPVSWNTSRFNKRKEAEQTMDELIHYTRSKFIAISYNDEGIIPIDSFIRILTRYGNWELMKQPYSTYRGSRNFAKRKQEVNELLWILEKY